MDRQHPTEPLDTPAQILGEFEHKKRYKGRLPVLRTVQRIVRERTVEDRSGPWSRRDTPSEGVRLILDVLRTAIISGGGKVRQFTKAEAEWVLKIRMAAPNWDGMNKVWILTRLYMIREQTQADTDDLDAFLASAPWTHAPADFNAPYETYKRQVEGGRVRPVMSYLWMRQEEFCDDIRAGYESGPDERSP